MEDIHNNWAVHLLLSLLIVGGGVEECSCFHLHLHLPLPLHLHFPFLHKPHHTTPAPASSFKLPSPLPSWPPGGGFATGTIDIGGLLVAEVTSFNKIWTTYEGGPDNGGATFFEPTGIPQGFSILGHYAQPNNRLLYGSVLVGKDATEGSSPTPALAHPTDYTLVWSSNSSSVKQDSPGYIWAPVPPNGFSPVGLIVTTTPGKPPLDQVGCVRSDLTTIYETDEWIWGLNKDVQANDFNIYQSRPNSRGNQASAVSIGTFMAQNSSGAANLIACLTNTKSNNSAMPNLDQVHTIIQTYSPKIYFHPDEEFLPSSVEWFFTNGALLYKKGDESNPVPVNPTGSNLPQGGSNDGSYWLDLPKAGGDSLKKGELGSARAYVHVKSMLGGTYTDLAVWVFYPFNGASRAKVGTLTVPLGKLGEHVGDWEHVTLRVSNFDGKLKKVYLAQHSGGQWVEASELEFEDGNSNRFVAYSSLHGHATYPRPGLVLQGGELIGVRNDAGKSEKVMETGKSYTIISAEYLGGNGVSEPIWLNYARKWGPKITYDIDAEIDKVAKTSPKLLKSAFLKFIKGLPRELLGEDGPTGPKFKNSWDGDEI